MMVLVQARLTEIFAHEALVAVPRAMRLEGERMSRDPEENPVELPPKPDPSVPLPLDNPPKPRPPSPQGNGADDLPGSL